MTYLTKLAAASLALTAIVFGTFNLAAKPARKGLMTVMQKDGTTMNIKKFGDEFSHYMLTEDGLPVIETGDGFVYAEADGEGNVFGTGVVAHAAAYRTADENAFLESYDAQGVSRKLQARAPKRSLNVALKNGKVTRGPGLTGNFPCEGEQKGLVVLVEYTDLEFRVENPHEYYDRMLNENAFNENGSIGSARDYFVENSHGTFRPHFDVYGPVKLKYQMAYYGGNDSYGDDKNAHKMAVEACQQLDGTVDFSEYDRDKDGYIDNIYVIYAGYGEADYASTNVVWPHSWELEEAEPYSSYYFDNVKLNKYACGNELDGSVKNGFRPDGIGTFVHEFSHVLGLPDLYCTNTANPFTPGEYSVLDYGPYNGDGCVPPNYSAFERYALDWMTPIELKETCDISLADITTNTAYILPTEVPREYFLFENRRQEGWDRYIPNHGMLVWHIDFLESVWLQNTVNNRTTHQYVDLVEADNLKTDASVKGDTFPGSANIRTFSNTTQPALKSWGNKSLAITSIENITETEEGLVSFHAVKAGDSSGGNTNPGTVTPVGKGAWTLVGASEAIDDSARYLIAGAESNTYMTTTVNSTKSASYFACGDNVLSVSNNSVEAAPDDAAVINFVPSSGGYMLQVSDVNGNTLGYIKGTVAKNVSLTTDASSAAIVSVEVGSFGVTLDFGIAGNLQYNASAPRFTTYTSTQEGLNLFRQVSTPTRIDNTSSDNQPAPVYSIDGRMVINAAHETDLNLLQPGIYIYRGKKISIIK